MDGCGHRCCEIPFNGYHTHAGRPSTCSRCDLAREHGAQLAAGHPNGTPTPSSHESHVLGRMVADVLARIAPQIPGLPAGTELTELVSSHALAVYAGSIVDPELQHLDERERRSVLAARVGLALAFPHG
jgi:hypothetical protein